MERLPKLNEEVYIVTTTAIGSLNIVKGHIIGVRQVSCAFTKYAFLVETAFFRCERFQQDIFATPEEIATNIYNFVVE